MFQCGLFRPASASEAAAFAAELDAKQPRTGGGSVLEEFFLRPDFQTTRGQIKLLQSK
jgi:hypothetical protein